MTKEKAIVDSIAEYLKSSDSPSMLFTEITAEVYGIEPSISLKKMFTRLIKLYGKQRLLVAWTDIITYYDSLSSSTNISRFETKLKRKLVRNYERELAQKDLVYSISLDKYIEDQEEQLRNKPTELKFREFEVTEESNE